MFNILSAHHWWSRECPAQLALSVDDEPVSYGELYRWSARVGAHLLDLGVKPQDRVSVVAQNSLEYAVLACALVRIGAIGAPLSFRSTPSELRAAWSDLQPTLVFADAAREATVREALGGGQRPHSLSAIAALRHGPDKHLSFAPDPDAPVFIIGTSGSTARPKGVIYTHRSIMTYASEFALMEPRCARGSRVLSLGPFSSSSGYLLLMQFTALGATVYIETQFRPERALQLLVEQRITTLQAAPIFFERIAALPDFARADLSALYWTQVGGARVAPALLETWRKKGVLLRQLYGSTEAGGGWGARDDAALASPDKCGRGGMFTQYAIRGADGALAPPNVPGEILVRSACLMAGYWNNPDATREALRDGWLHSGDLGMLDENGNLTFIDRLKDIIISGGLNISAAEVERAIGEIEGVEEVAVIAAQDADFGETPLAVIYGDAKRLSVPAIIEHCNRQLASFKVPRYVALAGEPLPRLPSGKISKPLLREQYRNAAGTLPKVR